MNKIVKWILFIFALSFIIGCSRKEIIGPIQYAPKDSTTYFPFPMPTNYSASIPYPNPFSDTCVVKLKWPRYTDIHISIQNSLKEEIKTIFSGKLVAGINGFYYFTILSDSFSCSSVVRLKR